MTQQHDDHGGHDASGVSDDEPVSDASAPHDTALLPPEALDEGEAPSEDGGAAETEGEGEGEIEQARALTRSHLVGLIEALVFASDKPMKALEVARLASAPVKQVRELLAEMKESYAGRGFLLDEVAGGWMFRTNVQFAPFVREVTAGRPVRLSRAQVETLAIVAYRQPVTRPEIDDIRGVDSGATLKLLLERDLVRILGKKDEPGRPLLYGTTTVFLEFFGLKSLRDLPTLREFTELSDESRRVAEAELGDVVPESVGPPADTQGMPTVPPPSEQAEEGEPEVRDTIAPEAPSTGKVDDPDEG